MRFQQALIISSLMLAQPSWASLTNEAATGAVDNPTVNYGSRTQPELNPEIEITFMTEEEISKINLNSVVGGVYSVNTLPRDQVASNTKKSPGRRGPDLTCVQSGVASTYGDGDGFHGRKTASGSRFDKNKPTVAHKTLPFGTWVRITNKNTGKTAEAQVTDRGPYAGDRIVDVATTVAVRIGMGRGLANIEMRCIPPPGKTQPIKKRSKQKDKQLLVNLHGLTSS